MSELSQPLVEVVRFADPLSWESWCLEPVVRRLEEVLGDGVRITNRMGGLFDNLIDWLEDGGRTKETTIGAIRTDAHAAGMPIHEDYIWRCGVKTSYTPCLAYKAAEMQDPQLAHRYLRRMMEAFMVEGQPASYDEYMQLGGEVGLNTNRLRRDIEIPLAKNQFGADRHAMSDAGVGFGSMMIRGTVGGFVRVDGFATKPYADAIKTVAPKLARHRPSDLVEYADRRRGLLPIRETAEVFRLTELEVAERMTTLATEGILEPVTSDAGDFWRWKSAAPDKLPLNVALAGYLPKPVLGAPELAFVLNAAARAQYTDVAERPRDPQPFPVGRDAVVRLGYPEEDLAAVPGKAIESFTGVGYVFTGEAVPRKSTVLDVGCGSGTDAILASRQLGRRGEVYGLDNTPAMAAKARACVEEAGLKHVQILDGDVAAIPLPPASVDVALSNGVLHMSQDKSAALSEIFRVLRPGGRLRLASVVVRNSVSETLGSDPDMWAGGLSGAPLETELPRILGAAGLRETRVVGDHDYFGAAVPPAVRRVARAVGGRTVVVEAMKPETPKKRR